MSEAFYRLLTVALCITTSAAAPQSTTDNTNITYVKIQPDILNIPTTNDSSRESRIQHIPLTIPNIDKNANQSNKPNESKSNYPDKVKSDVDPIKGTEDPTNPSEGTAEENISSYLNKLNTETRDNESLPDPILDQSNNTVIITAANKLTETISDSRSDNQTDHLASESKQFDRRIGDTTPSYEEAVTIDDVLEEITMNTEEDEETTIAPPPKLIPKLSHYGKSTYGYNSINLIGRSGERRFRSKCKCEKIWNCAKLQISVPRCPEEFFLCCS